MQAQLKRLSFDRERALSVGPLRGYPRAHVWAIASKLGGVVFVQHYLGQYATKFHNLFFEKNPKGWSTY